MQMNKYMKKLIVLIILVTMAVPNYSVTASTTKDKIDIGNYIKLIVDATKVTVNSTDNDPYITAALREGLIKEGEFTSYLSNITKEDAALIANRAEELLHSTTYDENLYNKIKDHKRISDLSKVTESNQDAVIKVFSKGIMIGSSNGLYTHSRKFNGKDALTTSEAKIIVARVKTPSKRRKLSPDGQLIRTTNLPKGNKKQYVPKPNKEFPYVVKDRYPTYKDYPYILESFPNSFYELQFNFNRKTYGYKPTELQDYASPAKISKIKYFDREYGYLLKDVLDNHLDDWAKKVETNLETRLNVDYRTVDNDWINKLRKTYYIYNDADMDKRKTNDIKEYVANMKKHKVIVKGTVSVEPSSLYFSKTFYVRAYIKFRVDCQGNYNQDFIFGGAYIKDFKKNQWNMMYVDIGVGSGSGGNTGDDYAVFQDSISEW